MYRWEITRAALAQRVFAIVRSETYDEASATADTLLSAGITSLEISLTTPFALEAVTTLTRELGDDAIIGAGTVLDAASARMAVDAGARFLVSPHLDAEVIRTGHRYGVPVFAGVSTPTEIVHGLELGADALKLFPASGHSPGWLRDVRAALPQAPLVPTGGVTVENAPEWIAAGAVAVGMGSALSAGDRDTVTKRAAALLPLLTDAAPPSMTPGLGSLDLYDA
ncbi:bifunctional 4-hydroxy-2-oxoglutarate aldolase/2-dehydro-3-deoxy-phosphogluconate aldolase [Streptomyces sclerotialus]|uniref:bifunctional 4-hydroxy-2-oxoglutarate aldolase/2-dehydro-3-deoxy-phosphogluconate aldolase n=1 Tax=Streptomyces sclerotialus TaxID=1957 RepID=UPI0004C49B14